MNVFTGGSALGGSSVLVVLDVFTGGSAAKQHVVGVPQESL